MAIMPEVETRFSVVADQAVPPLGDHESAFWLGDRSAVFLRRFEPESDGFLSIGDRFGAGVPMSHATGKLGNIDDEGVIFVAPPDDHFVTSTFHNSKKLILSEDFSHLFYLIRLCLRSLALKIDAFHDSRPCEDMMAAGNAHLKAFRLQQIADFVEANISIRCAAKKLLKSFFDAHELV